MFKYKTEAELAGMTEAERNQYAVDKREFEKGENKALIEDALKEFKAREKEEADKARDLEIKSANDKIKELQEQLAQLTESTGKAEKAGESLDALIEKALTEALPSLKLMKAEAWEKGKELVMEVKAAVNIGTGAVANAAGVTTPDSLVYQDISGYAMDVRADAYIINFLTNGTTDRASLPYMDKLPTEGAFAVTAQGTLKPLISVSFELRYSQAIKIAGRVKISEEALDDIPYIMSIIRGELKYEHDIAEQTAIFAKINAIAGAFVAGGMAASTDAPSNYDAIRAVIYAIKIVSKGRYIPNAALVPSSDVYNMGATKDTTNQYVFPPFVLPDGTKVAGVQIVEVNDDTVAVGSFVVGDFRKLHRLVYKSFTIRLGQGITVVNGVTISDFEANMYTMVGESRLHLWIYENEKTAFIKSTFAAVKTAIERVPAEG